MILGYGEVEHHGGRVWQREPVPVMAAFRAVRNKEEGFDLARRGSACCWPVEMKRQRGERQR